MACKILANLLNIERALPENLVLWHCHVSCLLTCIFNDLLDIFLVAYCYINIKYMYFINVSFAHVPINENAPLIEYRRTLI